MARGLEMYSHRAIRGTLRQHRLDDRFVGQAQHVVEVLQGVLWVTASVWTAENGDGALRPEEVGQRIRQLCGLGERADEDHVHIFGQFLRQVLEPGITTEGHVVTLFFAPDPDDLWHDARQVGIHDASIQRTGGALGDEVDDTDTEFAQESYPFNKKCRVPHRPTT